MVIVPIPVEAKLQVSENQTMKYMDVATASEKWGITGRRIRILCNDGRIDGALTLCKLFELSPTEAASHVTAAMEGDPSYVLERSAMIYGKRG